MKKKIMIGCLSVCVFFLVAIYFIYNSLCPKAERIEYPDYSSIESITVSRDGEQIYLSDEDCRELYEHIRTAKPTRKESVDETPKVTPFFTVEIKSKDSSIYGYGHVYQENEKFYFEIPYVGVYKFLDLV